MNNPVRRAAVAQHIRRIGLAALCSLLVVWTVPQATAAVSPRSDDVVRATLDNGLRVIIVRNTLAPVVSTSINYLVGADETPPGFPARPMPRNT